MSIIISEEELKEEGELLLEELRDLIESYEDFFRTNFSEAFFESIKKMKEDLNIAESVAIHEQLQREDKPVEDTLHWYNDYKDYSQNKTKDKKMDLIDRALSGFFMPDLESIVRILELVEIDNEIDGDLFCNVKDFLRKYKLFKELIE